MTEIGGYFGVDPAKLPNLPGSREEVQSAANILRGVAGAETLQVGKAATEFAFTHAPLANFDVIHLAIHAVAGKAIQAGRHSSFLQIPSTMTMDS